MRSGREPFDIRPDGDSVVYVIGIPSEEAQLVIRCVFPIPPNFPQPSAARIVEKRARVAAAPPNVMRG